MPGGGKRVRHYGGKRRMRIYLAGPDVFFPDPLARGATLKAVCLEEGLEGVFPLDPPRAGVVPGWLTLPPAPRIARCNEAHIRGCVALIANLTPFRGPSADPGTAYEIGFARGLGLPVLGWSSDPRPFTERTIANPATGARRGADGAWRDAEGLEIEAFGCTDNLMLDAAVLACGWPVVLPDPQDQDPMGPLRSCCRRVRRLLLDPCKL